MCFKTQDIRESLAKNKVHLDTLRNDVLSHV